ncbi:mitochondrial fission 1 protein isoform X2 [Uranotaenia lowii]|nr:mitochondrial fission 1 protein isoform X2 [Uranotaenia lowii]
MEDLLKESISSSELEKIEKKYNQELYEKTLSNTTQFEYAWCLVRSDFANDMRNGVKLMEDLCVKDPDGKRDYIYYVTIGYTRLKEYSTAMEFVKAFLEIEPTNQQVLRLEEYIKKKMHTEGMKDVAKASGAVLVIGGILGLGLAALASRK